GGQASVVVRPVTTSRARGGDVPVPVTAVSQYGQRRQSGSSGLLQRRHAFLSLVPQCGHDRKLGSAGLRQDRQTWAAPSLRSIARISSSRSRTSLRYSGGRRNR